MGRQSVIGGMNNQLLKSDIRLLWEDIVDVTYCHSCANQSLIGCRNKGSFVPVVSKVE